MAVLPLRDLLLPALWAATFLRRGIEWRGTAMAAPADAAELEEVTPQ
jgi:ceramide glucosyltransferase